jgi:manganese/zinc/iron transport system permease protein
MNGDLAIALVAAATSLACGLAGVFLVLRRTAMLADAVSHAVLPGLVAGYALANGPNLLAAFIGATVAGLATVGLVEALVRSRRVREDGAIGLVFPVLFALGVFWVSTSFGNVHLDADAVLFGEIALAPLETVQLGGSEIGPRSLWVMLGLAVVNALFLAAFWKQLKLSTFDPQTAAAHGAAAGRVQAGLMTVVALTTVGAFSSVGAVLAVSLLVVPAVVAGLLARRLGPFVAVTVLASLVASAAGQGVATALDVSISGMVAVALGVLFVLALLFAPWRGLLAQARAESARRRRFAAEMLVVHLATHESTPERARESAFGHLIEELGWSEARSRETVAWARRLGYLGPGGDQLDLTDHGRAVARQVMAR